MSLLKVNKAALKKSIVSPKGVSKYLREHRNDKSLQRPQITGTKKVRGGQKRNDIDFDDSKRQEGANLKDILFPPNGDMSEDRSYVEKSGQKKKGKLPFPRQTKSSQLCRDITLERKEKKIASETAKPWKMKKFTNVQSRWTLYMDEGKVKRQRRRLPVPRVRKKKQLQSLRPRFRNRKRTEKDALCVHDKSNKYAIKKIFAK